MLTGKGRAGISPGTSKEQDHSSRDTAGIELPSAGFPAQSPVGQAKRMIAPLTQEAISAAQTAPTGETPKQTA